MSQAVDGGADQVIKIPVGNGALGDMDNGAAGVEFGPPRGERGLGCSARIGRPCCGPVVLFPPWDTGPTKWTVPGRSERGYSKVRNGELGDMVRGARPVHEEGREGGPGGIHGRCSLAYFCTGPKTTFSVRACMAQFRTRPGSPSIGGMPSPYGAVSRLARLSGTMPQLMTAGRSPAGPASSNAAPMNNDSARTASTRRSADAARMAWYWAFPGRMKISWISKRIPFGPFRPTRPGKAASRLVSSKSASGGSGMNEAPVWDTWLSKRLPVRKRTSCPCSTRPAATASIGVTWPTKGLEQTSTDAMMSPYWMSALHQFSLL